MCQIENNIVVIEKNVEGVVKSQSFLSDQYENKKKTMDNLMKKNMKLEKEMNVVLQDNTKKIKKNRSPRKRNKSPGAVWSM